MKLKKFYGTLFPILFFIFNSKSQILKVGDMIPNYKIKNIINYSTNNFQLSEFRGKVILIDFWNTYCSSCIESFPKLDSLQNIFKDDLQIILVTDESYKKVTTFFGNHPKLKIPNLIMITDDLKLGKSFPSQGKPYVVWINNKGVIENFSNSTNISNQNLRYFIEGKKMLFRDPTLEKNGEAIVENNFEYISFISRCNETLNIGNRELHVTNNGKSVSIKRNCSSIVNLFIIAFREFGKYNFETQYGVKLNLSDTFKYQYPQNLELMDYWLNQNAYNYQLVLPQEKIDQAYEIMQQDLIRFFALNAYVKNEYINGIKIFKDTINQQTSFKNSTKEYIGGNKSMVICNDSLYIFKDEPYEKISKFFKSKLSYYFPIIDSLNLTEKFSLSIRKSTLNPFNLNQFKEDLENAGLNCAQIKIEEEILYIEDKKDQ